MRTRRLGAGGARLAKHSGNSGAGVQSVAVCWWCPSRVGLVGSVRFFVQGWLAAGVSKQLVCLLESCCVGYVCLVRNGRGLFPACFLAYRLFPARALAAARRFLYARHEACDQQTVIMGIETWRRVRLFALIVVS